MQIIQVICLWVLEIQEYHLVQGNISPHLYRFCPHKLLFQHNIFNISFFFTLAFFSVFFTSVFHKCIVTYFFHTKYITAFTSVLFFQSKDLFTQRRAGIGIVITAVIISGINLHHFWTKNLFVIESYGRVFRLCITTFGLEEFVHDVSFSAERCRSSSCSFQ